MVKDVEENPFIPIAWQFGHKGMQGTEYVTEESDFGGISVRNESWLAARDYAIELAKDLNSMDTTKQLCNRLLEPFMWTTELITTGEEGLHNFFELRCPKYEVVSNFLNSEKEPCWKERYYTWKHFCKNTVSVNNKQLSEFTELERLYLNKSQAEIHIQKIAEMLWDAYNESEPKDLEVGKWHIPFGNSIDENRLDKIRIYYRGNTEKYESDEFNFKIKIAIARCARLSYTTLGDNPKIDYEADIKLHNRLLESKHLSCFEHCARAMSEEEYESFYKGEGANKEHTRLDENKGWCNNYRGFIQYRYLVENE
jgi:hypothetical protein